MLLRRHAPLLLGIAIALGSTGCVTLPPNSPRAPQDPWESWNRGVYRVNDKLDRAVTKPIARTYVRLVPAPARTGISNFMQNLRTTTILINDALQGKFKASATDLARLLANTTLGIGGLLDPATKMGLDKNDEEFGQTLGVWGVPPGPFIELPFFGPSDARDGPARIVDIFTNPTHYIKNTAAQWSLYAVDLLDARASLLSLDGTLKNVYDPYAFIRDAYLQRRAYLISDGKVTEEPLIDPGADEPAAPPPNGGKVDTAPADAPPPKPPQGSR